MKKPFALLAAVSAGMAFADVCTTLFTARPSVSNVTMAPKAGTRSYVVSYDLNTDAYVTVAFETNGVALPAELCADVGGNVNRYVAGGDGRQIVWRPDRLSGFVDLKNVKPVVTVWPLDVPPPYMVVQLDSSSNVAYYASAAAIPDGVAHRRYKTTHMVFAKIPAAGRNWTMGNVAGERGTDTRELIRTVTFTRDYYMAIYECTGGQYLQFMDSNPTTVHPCAEDLDVSPVCNPKLSDVRSDGSDGNFGLPPAESSYVGRMRARTGLAVDLPTHAEWEVAARAGCSERVNVPGATMNDVAWTSSNWKNDPKYAAGLYTKNQPHEVGLLKPNAFGLYDTIGNVLEQGREWLIASAPEAYVATFGKGATLSNYGDVVWVDPAYFEKSVKVGGTTYTAANTDCGRWGGGYTEAATSNGMSPSRWAGYGLNGQTDTGFRLMCPVANGGKLD